MRYDISTINNLLFLIEIKFSQIKTLKVSKEREFYGGDGKRNSLYSCYLYP